LRGLPLFRQTCVSWCHVFILFPQTKNRTLFTGTDYLYKKQEHTATNHDLGHYSLEEVEPHL
jgi:hypothetical protein